MWARRSSKKRTNEIHPDEILLDVHNLPAFDRQQFEGRLERPISKWSLNALLVLMAVVALSFVGRLGYLQIGRHAYFEKKSEQNSLDHIPIIADRGVIYDRNGMELAWNQIGQDGSSIRAYIKQSGFANMLGYVSYPTKDAKGKYWQFQTVGKDGIEQRFNDVLAGKNGTKLIETDVSGEVIAENAIDAPVQGENLTLTIDARIQGALAQGIKDLAKQSGYIGGAGAVMDIYTGELLALTTYPEYDQHILSDGSDATTINAYFRSESRPFLNRMTEGFTPGSIVKPFLALAALKEGIITPSKVIYTTGSLRIPNPYNPGQFSVFKDNKNHGAVDMKKALAISSNVYFYQIGGGFGDQKGLGINAIERYLQLFGIGSKTGINAAKELTGTIPSIAWKQKTFPGDPWRIGDTYNTSIGQYGFQVTPIQMLRAVAGIASKGTLVTPTIVAQAPQTSTELPFAPEQYRAVFEGMRMVVTEGTAQSLNNPSVAVAAKSGTAQIKNNTRINSWVIGFFPYEKPKYAFVVLMENGPKISSGAANAFKPVLPVAASIPGFLP